MHFALDGLSITLIVLGILAVLVLLAAVKTVPQGYNYTVERFGRYMRTLKPGLGLIVPFVDGIGRKINMMEQVLEVPQQEVITKDNASVTANAVTFYQILDAAAAAYEVTNLAERRAQSDDDQHPYGDGLDGPRRAAEPSRRDQLAAAARRRRGGVSPWGIKITRIEIKDIDPPRDLVESMGRQMKAEREKRATVLEAEGKRQSAILQAEGAKQAQVLEAEGRREAAFRDAEARERSAEAEAKATQVVSDAIASGSVQAINYFVANNYIKALESLARSPNQKILMLPVEAASVIGALGGIAEIARETFGGEKPAVRPSSGSSGRPPSTNT